MSSKTQANGKIFPVYPLVREGSLVDQVVIVDGQPGCGKTMLAPIVAALDRVELLSYSYEVESICRLHYLGKITDDVAITMLKWSIDLKIYNTMMSRDTNFRFRDISSAFQDAKPWRYFKRLFQQGDEFIPKRIKKEKPILNLTTHNLLGLSAPLFQALGAKLTIIEVVRHPLYMLKQQVIYKDSLHMEPRDFDLFFNYEGKPIPYYAYGWEDLFLRSNTTEKSVYCIQKMTELAEQNKQILTDKYKAKIVTIPFEHFVLNPSPFMEIITSTLKTKAVELTKKVMKKQNVPRKKNSDGIPLAIYKRCGWEPPDKNLSENEELEKRRQYAVEQGASDQALKVLDKLCVGYESNYYKVSERRL